MPRETLEQIDYSRKVRRCKTLDQLQKLWTKIQNKQYKKIDKWLNDAYTKKLDELNQQTNVSAKKID